MKKMKYFLTAMICVLMLSLGIVSYGKTNESASTSTAMDYTSQFVGTWEADFSDFPVYADQGITGVAGSEFKEDGTLITYLDGEQADTFGYFVYKNYYVAVGEDGSAEVTQYKFSDDGKSLEFSDLDGNWMLTYTKTK
ncbi:MAG: hypothetical protein Q4C61_06140 [Lachnospiraceae bacterium]|nr:hypothetical protein [Lachnospiraceae bacterium]